MKHIQDMSDEEILKLNQEDINNLIQLRYAEEGVKLMQPPVEPTKHVFEPDLKRYEVNDIYFLTFEDAAAFVAAMRKGEETSYEWKVGSEYKYLKELNSYRTDIKEVGVFSKEKYLQVKDQLTLDTQAQENYKQMKKEYEECLENSAWIREEVNGRVQEVWDRHNRLEDLRRQFTTYLKLAEGNTDIAINFLTKAYGELSADDLAYIVVPAESVQAA